MAVNCWVVPRRMLGLAGVTAMDDRVGAAGASEPPPQAASTAPSANTSRVEQVRENVDLERMQLIPDFLAHNGLQ